MHRRIQSLLLTVAVLLSSPTTGYAIASVDYDEVQIVSGEGNVISNNDIEAEAVYEEICEQPESVAADLETDFIPMDKPLDAEIQEYIYNLCYGRSIDQEMLYQLVMAVIERESNFQPGIISATDDYGLMQINRGPNGLYHSLYREKYAVSNFLDPKQNVFVGIELLCEYLQKYNGNIRLSLMCYGSGEGGAQEMWNRGIYTDFSVEKAYEIMRRNGVDIW